MRFGSIRRPNLTSGAPHKPLRKGQNRRILKQLYATTALTRTDGASLYPLSEFVGKALSQVGFNGEGKLHSKDSEVFEKWGQAIASSNQLIKRAASLNWSMQKPLQNSAVLPVLVVPDGTLWVVNYSGLGDRTEPAQAQEAKYFIGSTQTIDEDQSVTFILSHLHIVTKAGLEKLLLRFREGGQDVEHIKNMLY